MSSRPKLIRITTVPIALKYLLAGQMKYMKEHGFEVIMVSADGTGRDDAIKQEDCPHIVIPMTRKITPVRDLVSLWRLYRLFRKERPDIVHSHTPKAGLLSMIAAKWAGVKIRIHTVAGLRFMTATGIKRKIMVSMEKLTAKKATHVWPNSFSLLGYIQQAKLIKSSKLGVIGHGSSNGINLQRFSPSALNADHVIEVKKLVGYDPQLTYLLCVGRIVRDKGIDELLWAFAELYKKNDRLRLILVGSPEDELDPIGNDARKILESHPGIIMTGWREDVEYFMSISCALVHPSYREGFPNVLLQAGAMNCPVICSRIAGNVDVVDHGTTGSIFEPRDKASLLQCLETALSKPPELKIMAGNLRRKVEEYFDQRVVHESIKQRYLELLPSEKKQAIEKLLVAV